MNKAEAIVMGDGGATVTVVDVDRLTSFVIISGLHH